MRAFFKGFVYAGRGLWFCLRHERNFRIHLVAAAAVLGLAPFFRLSRGEWAVLLVTLALVIGAEALNTAVEQAVDLASPDRHPKARAAKDAAAGAVLVCAAAAVGVGFALFFRPAVWAWLGAALVSRPWLLVALILLAVLAFWFIAGAGVKDDSRK